MKHYTVTEITQTGRDIAVVTLVPKSEADRLEYYPGQYATIGFSVNGRPTPMRCFSMTSSPHDATTLQFAMKVKGDFTHTVSQLDIGQDAFLQGPFGTFIIDPEYDKAVVLLAAGIGITPFISIIRHAAITRMTIPITLLYSVREQQDIAFLDEIRALERQNPYFKAVFFVTGETAPMPDERLIHGKIDEQRLDQLTGGRYQGATYFICGPKGFTEAEAALLKAKQVSDHRIVSETFAQSNQLSFGNRFSIPKLTYAVTAAGLVLAFGFFMSLDLSRYVSKNVSAAAPSTTTSEVIPATTATPTTSSTVTNSTSSSASTTPSSSTTNQTTTTPTYYQQPVSRMS